MGPCEVSRVDRATGTDILLTTINARHAHSSLALRYLLANLGPWRHRADIVEFVSGGRIEAMAEALLARSPRVIGFSVYIWNVEETTQLIGVIKAVAPDVFVIIGGPEVSHEWHGQPIVALADHLITGPGEISLPRLCGQLIDGPRPLMKVIAGESVEPDQLASPYALYSDTDIAHRYLYVEASRGCPFKCEFCLSSLDRTAVPFDTTAFLRDLAILHQRGARQFKFIDRTFNLKVSTSLAILDFMLEKIVAAPHDPVFAHFELVPDHLPASLREKIAMFPAGTLQFEIGIQTWNPRIQALISRRQDNDKASANLRWLREHSRVHLHVDLIAGLPGEDLDSFAAGFDRLWALRPHEIQVGVLKRLRGTPIIRHTDAYGLRFNPNPPYNVLSTDAIGFVDMQRINRFARYWDLVANSGRFADVLPRLLGQSPFARFMAWSDWLYARTDSTYRFSPQRLSTLLDQWLTEHCGARQPGPTGEVHGSATAGPPLTSAAAGPSLTSATAGPALTSATPRRQSRFQRDPPDPPWPTPTTL